MKKKRLWLALLFSVCAMLAACSINEIDNASNKLFVDGEKKVVDAVSTYLSKRSTDTSGTVDKIPVEYIRTVDGDTIKVMYEGEEMSVRYLLIDTPESVHPKMGKQPFGEDASERNKELLESGDQVYLEFDVGERVDKYGRLLAYVYIGDTNVQEVLVAEGLARVAYVYPPNTRHLDLFEKAQAHAKENGYGVWSLDGYVNERGFENN